MLERFERYALLTILFRQHARHAVCECVAGLQAAQEGLRGSDEQYRSFGYFVSWGNRIYEEQGGELSAARRTKVSLKEGPVLSRNWLDKSNMA